MRGRAVEEYCAPLFIAWHLTSRCEARGIACCEESGPDKAWGDVLRRDEALELARSIAAFGIVCCLWRGRAAGRALLLGTLRAAR